MQSNDQIVNKWASRTAGATEAYKDGIRNTTVNPMERAAASIPLYLQKVQEAVSSGRMANKLANTPKEKWSGGALNKGAARISAGVNEAKPAFGAYVAKFRPVWDQIKQEVASMPKGDTEAGLARVRVAMQRMKAAAGKPI